MTDYKLIAFDMDGTLLDSHKKMLPDSIEMINAAIDAGKIVVLSTGRCIPELWEFLPQLSKLQYIICTSGALVYDPRNDQEIYSCALPEETVQHILNTVKDLDVMIHFLSTASVVEKDKIPLMDIYHMEPYRPMYEAIATGVENIHTYYKENTLPLYKLNLYFKTPHERDFIRKQLEPVGLALTNAETTSLECSAPLATKGNGLRQLCDFLNISIEETIAVGDADNDLDIMKTAGLAVAMGNANENIKKIADVIVSDNDHGGCAQAIRRYLLGMED